MTTKSIDAYLVKLAQALRTEGIAPDRLVCEAREHLLDSARGHVQAGVAEEEACCRAIARFGEPQLIARALAEGPYRRPNADSIALAALWGVVMMLIDAAPNWDDTGVTAGALILSGAAAGYSSPRHVIPLALALGACIALRQFMLAQDDIPFAAAGALAVLVFPVAGAMVGRALRLYRKPITRHAP